MFRNKKQYPCENLDFPILLLHTGAHSWIDCNSFELTEPFTKAYSSEIQRHESTSSTIALSGGNACL